MDIKKIMVVGSGFMGSGISQVAAAAGFSVIMQDIKDELIRKGLATIETNLKNSVAKGKLHEDDKNAILGRITSTLDLSLAKDCDIVIEVIFENKQAKAELYKKLEEICSPQVIFASNTSSIPITELAAFTKRPEKFAGMHFFSPAPVMKLVEVIMGLKTSAETAATIKDLAEKFGKIPVYVKDGPGFLVNRINFALRNESFRCLAEGVATIEDIDKALKFGLNHPMGVFELIDFVGLDIALAGVETLWEYYKDPRWAPSLILKKMVSSGDLGRKSGKGWYDYTSGEKKPRTDLNF